MDQRRVQQLDARDYNTTRLVNEHADRVQHSAEARRTTTDRMYSVAPKNGAVGHYESKMAPNTSQGRVATRVRCDVIRLWHKFTAEYHREIISKIDQHLAQSPARVGWHLFVSSRPTVRFFCASVWSSFFTPFDYNNSEC